MNERIRELAEQAGYSKDFLAVGLPNNMEKFAELIVRDCLQIVENECDNTPYDDGFHMGEFCGTLMVTIEKNFGIKE